MMLFQFLSLATVIAITVSAADRKWTLEEQLVVHLVQNNDRNVLLSRPANFTTTVPVKIGLSLTHIKDYDDLNQYVTVSSWLELWWDDYRLKWNPEDYAGVKMVPLPINRIWQPDVKLFNGVHPDMVKGDVMGQVYYTGQVFYGVPVQFTINCRPNAVRPKSLEDDLSHPKFCSARLGSWTYDASKITLLPSQIKADPLSQHPIIAVTGGSSETNYHIFDAYSDKQWEDVSFNFNLAFRDPNKVLERLYS